jgi:hypothetical protein
MSKAAGKFTRARWVMKHKPENRGEESRGVDEQLASDNGSAES